MGLRGVLAGGSGTGLGTGAAWVGDGSGRTCGVAGLVTGADWVGETLGARGAGVGMFGLCIGRGPSEGAVLGPAGGAGDGAVLGPAGDAGEVLGEVVCATVESGSNTARPATMTARMGVPCLSELPLR